MTTGIFELDGPRPVMTQIKRESLKKIAEFLRVTLGGEFESEVEYEMTSELYEECRKALNSSQAKSKPVEIDQRIKTIAEHYGFKVQLGKTIDELDKLLDSIIDFSKEGGNEADKLASFVEKLADVKIILDQLVYLAGDFVMEEIEYKINHKLRMIA